MAGNGYDGSLKFDTKINTDEFEQGTGSLLKAAEHLTLAIERLSTKMDRAFSSSGAAAASTARQVDEITESVKKAGEEMERLQKEKDATFSGTIENNTGAGAESKLPDDGKRYNLYGQDVDAIIAKNRELEVSARQTSATVTTESQKEENAVVSLKDSMIFAVEAFKHFPQNITTLFQSATAAMDGTKLKARTLQDEIDRYQDALYYAEKKGLGLGDAEYDKAYKGLTLAKAAAEKYKKKLMGVEQGQKKVSKSANQMSSSMNKAGKSAGRAGRKMSAFSMLGRSVLFSMVFRGISMISKAFTEGIKNVARYSDAFNDSISSIMSANTRMKNSFASVFAPALQAAAPILKQMIDLLSSGATYAGQFIAALTGKSTFVKAVDVEEDYAASLGETNKELKEKEKATKKLAFAFDDLIQAQGGNSKAEDAYKPPTPDQMFETVEIETDIKDFAETVKGILSDLFTPIEKSWKEKGSTVVASAKYALGELGKLGKDVGNDFMTIWEKEGYGKAVTDDILISVSNLLDTVGNLAAGFDRAWQSGDAGLFIMRHLGDLLLEVTGLFRDATGEIKNWSSKLDFSPLLKSFDNVLVKLRPVVNKIGDLLLWLLGDILLPLAQWGIENGLPSAFDLIAAAFSVLNSILEALKPSAIWLWEDFLQPIGEWTGSLFIAAIQKIVKWLETFSGWIDDNQGLVQNITLAVLAFFAAWKVVEFAGKITTMVGKLGELILKLGTLDLKFAAIVLVIGSIVFLAVKVAQAWDKMTPGQKVATAFIAVAGAIALVVAAVAAFTKDFATLIIAGGIAAIAGLSIAGIAASANKKDVSGSSSRVNSLSGKGLSLANRAIPRLATGTVIPPRAGEFAAILGDNNRDTEIVSPVPAMKQAFKEAIAEMGGIGGNQTLKADLILDGTKFGQLVYKFNHKEQQRVGVRLVAKGEG